MYLVDQETMNHLDRETIETYGLPGMVLMEQAALRAVELLSHRFNGLKGKNIIIFAGKGNNGGDGLAMARLLENGGAHVTLFLLCQPEELAGDALTNYRILHGFGIKVHLLADEKDLQKADIALMRTDIIVDAIFGTGFKGTAGGIIGQVINLINNSGLPVVSLDLPSGLEADSGKISGPCVKAWTTITFGLPKLGLILEPGASYVGELWWGDISLPRQLVQKAGITTRLITHRGCVKKMPQRRRTGHKGTFGHVIVIGGSEGMAGAITLAGLGALRSGAGLVTAAVPRSLHNIMEMKTTEIMTKSLPETDDITISQEALDIIMTLADQANAILLGPGMSQHPSTASLLTNLLPKLIRPVVLDADALNMISEMNAKEFFTSLRAPLIITPHPGEMARLMGVSVKEVQQNRVEMALTGAREWQVVVVLKGAKTLIASPDGRLYVNPTGNAGMATGGSGDVLAGMITALLGQGLELLDGAMIAVYAHGKAGDESSIHRSQIALTAGDLLEELPEVFLSLESDNSSSTTQINERLAPLF